MKEFKDALCMKPVPGADYSGLSVRHRYCQRRDKHKGPHRSWSREWNNGDDTSRLRGKTDRSPREWQQALSVGGELAKESQIRKEFIDYDARRKPRTKRFCVKCQKDLDPGKPVRRVYVTRDMEAVHPDDIGRYPRSGDDFGWLLIGNDCARILGMEWSVHKAVGVESNGRER